MLLRRIHGSIKTTIVELLTRDVCYLDKPTSRTESDLQPLVAEIRSSHKILLQDPDTDAGKAEDVVMMKIIMRRQGNVRQWVLNQFKVTTVDGVILTEEVYMMMRCKCVYERMHACTAWHLRLPFCSPLKK